MSRVLITGGLGFQGMHLARACAARGDAVTVLNTPSPRAMGTMLPALLHGLDTRYVITVVLGSVTDADTLEKVVPGHDVVLHLAAWASVDQSLDRPWPPWEVNAQGTMALLEAVRRFGQPGARIVFGSSCEVYGPAVRVVGPSPYSVGMCVACRVGMEHTHQNAGDLIPQNEDTPMLPRSPYAASKVASDRMAYAYAVTYGLDLAILRPCNVYGPWQRHGGFGAVIPTFVHRATYGQPLVVTGGGRQVREYLHVDDVVAAYLALALSPARFQGDTFNVGTGETTTIQALAEQVAAHFDPAPVITHSDARVADVSGFLLDSTKFRANFAWAPSVKFADGLAGYVAWTRAAGKVAWR